MKAAELDAAGITDPVLRHAYAACRRVNAVHGKTFFLATRLLPARARPAAHALYGFARAADELVDNPAPGSDPEAGLALVAHRLDLVFAGSETGDPLLAAFADTVRRYRLDRALFDAFLHSMRMDLSVTAYRTFAELAEYTHGSAAVIGLQMLPLLGTEGPLAEAEPYAAALGEAFQLTNFLRDVGEDLDRGGCTCRSTNSPRSASTASCCGGRSAPGGTTGGSAARSPRWWRATGRSTGGPSQDFLAAQGVPALRAHRARAVRRHPRRDRRLRLRRTGPAGGRSRAPQVRGRRGRVGPFASSARIAHLRLRSDT